MYVPHYEHARDTAVQQYGVVPRNNLEKRCVLILCTSLFFQLQG